MLGRDVLISWVRNIPWSSQKTKDFRREIIWDFFSSIWDFFAIFCQASRYRARFQASSGHSDSANRPGYEAGVYVVAIAVIWVVPIITSVIIGIERFLMTHHLYLLESHCCLCLMATFVSYTSILFKFRFGAHPQRHCAAALRQRKLTVTLFITTLLS